MIELLLLTLIPWTAAPAQDGGGTSPFELALRAAERALEGGGAQEARKQVMRALERDAKSVPAWVLRAEAAALAEDRDEQVYCLHVARRLAAAQGLEEREEELRARLLEVDPIAADLLDMNRLFIDELLPIANDYEEQGRLHSAIRVHKEVLALDPEQAESLAAIERIASNPDPSLAGDAKPRDLLADVSDEWIREHDEETRDWGKRAKLERENYKTETNAGYEVLVRCAEAMEQMNAFYRQFFEFGTEEHSGTVPPIALLIFRERDEYLKLGSGPAEWSGGQFTGAAVETFVGDGGFENMTNTLFHEAAHQFVSLATQASGWLNEGLASFFEGCRILPNGSVLMNEPANHRLIPLVRRMERGWMEDHEDGIAISDPNQVPTRAPTFRIVMENRYQWGPAWYAPTWGVVYFLYNYQDPVDGRYVYRRAFREFIDKSGGRTGEGAVRNFEELVLANPEPPLKGVERPDDAEPLPLPATIDELTEVWRDWLITLEKEVTGRLEVTRPYADWARYAQANGLASMALEHYEKAFTEDPDDVSMLVDFAEFLADERDDSDRATKLANRALGLLDQLEEPDEDLVKALEKKLAKWDPTRRELDRVHEQIWAASRNVVQRYQGANLPMMVMDVSSRLGSSLGVPGLYEMYEEAARVSGRTLDLWRLAYDEHSLAGWTDVGDGAFTASGIFLDARGADIAEHDFVYTSIALDEVLSGDFSFSAQMQAESGTSAFAGLTFGRKGASNLHAVVLFPAKERTDGAASTGFIDLVTFFGTGADYKTWRHTPVDTQPDPEKSQAGIWHELRIDVSGRIVDVWFDDEFVTTQEFPNRELLRGSLGLLTGPGKARYRNVRFLSRYPNDPAGRVLRDLRLEQIRAESGGGLGGSYLGAVPPFPQVQAWAQGERSSWDEVGPVPQLFVMWSTQQNDMVPIHEWLAELADEHEDVGLRIVSLCSPNDVDSIDDYLAAFEFPDVVGVDQREGIGIGDTFEQYQIARFNLPRVLLLDVDQKVVWEGDPGFKIGEEWYPGLGTYLDAPLEELIANRKLRQLQPWRARWNDEALPALKRGDVATALPVLFEAREFKKGAVAEVDDAWRKLEALETTLDALETTGHTLVREGTEPAMDVLLGWAPLLDREPDKKELKKLAFVQRSDAAKDWKDALDELARWKKRAKPGTELEKAADLLAKLDRLEGTFATGLRAAVQAAVDAGDVEALQALAETAPDMPGSWLITEFFGW